MGSGTGRETRKFTVTVHLSIPFEFCTPVHILFIPLKIHKLFFRRDQRLKGLTSSTVQWGRLRPLPPSSEIISVTTCSWGFQVKELSEGPLLWRRPPGLLLYPSEFKVKLRDRKKEKKKLPPNTLNCWNLSSQIILPLSCLSWIKAALVKSDN